MAAVPDEVREFLEVLALHEAGHAVAAAVHGFALGTIWIVIDALWTPDGTTESGAHDVSPRTHDDVQCRAAAEVAMAGQEARRQRYPDDRWKMFDLLDHGDAIDHLGLRRQDTVAVLLNPELLKSENARLERALEPFAAAARMLLLGNWRAVEDVKAALMAGLTAVDDGSLRSSLAPDAALRIIRAAGVRTSSATMP